LQPIYSTISDKLELMGELRNKYNSETQKYEVLENFFSNDTTEDITTKKHNVIGLQAKITSDSTIEEIYYDTARNTEIRRPIRDGMLQVSKGDTGARIIESFKPVDGPEYTRDITGTLRKMFKLTDSDGGFKEKGLMEVWVGKDGFVRKREINGQLIVFTKEDGELGLKELNVFSRSRSKTRIDANSDSRNIRGVIKSTGNHKSVMVDEFLDESNYAVRIEIRGMLLEYNSLDEQVKLILEEQNLVSSDKIIVHQLIDDNGNIWYKPIIGTIKIIASDKRKVYRSLAIESTKLTGPNKSGVEISKRNEDFIRKSEDIRGPIY
jgi:hypothetical protein